MRRILLRMLPVLLLFTATNAAASTIAWNGAGANDFFDWSQLGPDVSTAPSGFTAVSNLARTAILADGGVGFISCQEAPTGPCEGDYNDGDWLLATINNDFEASTVLDVSFNTAVAAVGTHAASNTKGDFTMQLDVFAGATRVGTYSVDGTNNQSGVGILTLPFLGAQSDAADITRAVFTLTAQPGPDGLTIDRLLTRDAPFTPSAAVPEPATLGLVGAGMLAALRCRRQRRYTSHAASARKD
jgi:PEP-CTERM motif